MRKLRVTILDLVSQKPTTRRFASLMNANLASVMPQAVGVWCERLGHEVRFECYTGSSEVSLPALGETDVLFIGAFTRSAQLAYALSRLYRDRGAVTVLGGPHARCYPQDASQYFDYVLGFTDESLIGRVLEEAAPRRDIGLQLQAERQPKELPGLEERWRFIEGTLAKAPPFKVVPMLASMGCPYTCSFCIDSVVPHQPLDNGQLCEDLRFLARKMHKPVVGWHDPNFGVRFDELMDSIEAAVPPGSIRFICESTLSLLSEERLRRLKKLGCKGLMPGIESWFSLGNKSSTGAKVGMAKVEHVAEHVNMILRYVPFVQTNFVLGLDDHEGPEPFELTKRFLDLAPGAFPAFSLLTSYGQAAPLNLDLQRAGRVLPFPHHLLDSTHAMNVRPLHYGWMEFFEHAASVTRHGRSLPSTLRRLWANGLGVAGRLNFIRATSSNRVKYQAKILDLLRNDRSVLDFFEGRTQELPAFFKARIQHQLGPLWEALPAGALYHDQNAYLASQSAQEVESRPAAHLPEKVALG